MRRQSFQVAGANSHGMECLDEIEHLLELWHEWVVFCESPPERMQKTEFIDVTHDELSSFALRFAHLSSVELLQKVLLQGFLACE